VRSRVMNHNRAIPPLLLLLAAGCGYRVVRGDNPFGAEKIAVIPFAEEEPIGISGVVARELAALLARDGVHIVMSPEHADAVLSGTVLSEQTSKSPVAATGTTVPAYRIAVTVEAHLKRHNEKLWSGQANSRDSFLPARAPQSNDWDTQHAQTHTLQTDANRRQALERLAVDLAHTLHQQLVIDGELSRGGN